MFLFLSSVCLLSSRVGVKRKQKELVSHLLKGKYVLAVLATGFGKSCFVLAK